MLGSKPNIDRDNLYFSVVGIWDYVMIIEEFLIGEIVAFGDDSDCVDIHIFVVASSVLRYLLLYLVH